MVSKILPALAAFYSVGQLFLCPKPVRDDRGGAWFAGLLSLRAILAFMGLAQPESDFRTGLCNYNAQ